ncbi:MOSC domain-containing protein [Leeia oryzae]|uniref:MOSC domain-containing protein n=1 Tax=Leeia oryzae TaxID=356662 RepID=UPI00036FA499|nr:MOSC domain-containing protein [Leeia oryzae]
MKDASMHVSALYTYPLKSGAPFPLSEAYSDHMGLPLDRHWMIATPEGRFITGREYPQLVTIRLTFIDKHIQLQAPDMPILSLTLDELSQPADATVWGQTFGANTGSQKANDWTSQFLGIDCILYYIGSATQRFREERIPLSFADGYPLLLAGESSLTDLNNRLEKPVSMLQFRPNIVIAGAPAFEEDFWASIRIGEVELTIRKPCERCVFTTVDPQSGIKSADNEPLVTLSSYRNLPDWGICFGQNLEVTKPGLIKVGDEVDILDWQF